MKVLNFTDYNVPLSAYYSNDNNVEIDHWKTSTADGVTFISNNFLTSVEDNKINNYSALYLTNQKKLNDILKISTTPNIQNNELNCAGDACKIGNKYSLLNSNTGIGALWTSSKYNINEFNVEFYLYSVTDNLDPDRLVPDNYTSSGYAFVIQNKNNQVIGNRMGYNGIDSTGLVIEFDQYYTQADSDPSYNHIAVLSAMNTSHNYELTHYNESSLDLLTPQNLTKVNIIYASNTLEVYFNDNKRIELNINLADILDFDEGYFGLTGQSSIFTKFLLVNQFVVNNVDYINTQTNFSIFSSALSFYYNTSPTFLSFNNSLSSNYRFINSIEYTDPNNKLFEVELISDKLLKIGHQTTSRKYYLTYKDNNIAFSNVDAYNVFSYVLDKKNNKIALFIKSNDGVYTLSHTISGLMLVPAVGIDVFNNTNTIHIDYYIQDVNFNINTSWVAYDTFDIAAQNIRQDKSTKDLPSNYIFYTQYSDITGNDYGVNFLTLKNQHSHKGNSYRSDNFNVGQNAPVNARNYTSIFTGNNQEGGDGAISLNYEFYSGDYIFEAGKYTTFTTPPSLYPYKQLNINDTLWASNGAIPGKTPYFSDKVYWDKKAAKFNDGQYLCTWLSGGSTDTVGVWCDRYYYPEKVSYVQALTTINTAALIDPVEQLILNNTNRNSFNIFDKLSDLVLLPGQQYIYYRLGNEVVTELLDTINNYLTHKGFDKFLTSGDVLLNHDSEEEYVYDFDGDKYAFIEDYNKINTKRAEFTISTTIDAIDWSKPFGHEIMGNFTDSGFGIFNDQKVTPLVMVTDNNRVLVYNTNFEKIDEIFFDSKDFSETEYTYLRNRTYYTNITATHVKELFRTDHLLPCGAITTTQKLSTHNTKPPIIVGDSEGCALLLADYLTPTQNDLQIHEPYEFITTEPVPIFNGEKYVFGDTMNFIIEPCGIDSFVNYTTDYDLINQNVVLTTANNIIYTLDLVLYVGVKLPEKYKSNSYTLSVFNDTIKHVVDVSDGDILPLTFNGLLSSTTSRTPLSAKIYFGTEVTSTNSVYTVKEVISFKTIYLK